MGKNAIEVFTKIKEGKYSFDSKEWSKVSSEAKDLITGMLKIDTYQRLSAKECLEHDWFRVAEELKDNVDMDALDYDLLKNLKEFKGYSVLKKAALNVFVKMLTSKEVRKLKKQFEQIDTDLTGYIDAQELYEAMKISHFDLPAQEIESIINEIGK